MVSIGNMDLAYDVVFLDRDGTVIEDSGYLSDPDGVVLLPNAVNGLKLFQAAGLKLVIVTNQSGIGRGYYEVADYEAVTARMVDMLVQQGVVFDAIRFCADAPEAPSDWRKPAPGMLLDAARFLEVDPSRSIMIGDKQADMQAGRAVGAKTVLVQGPGSHVSKDVPDAEVDLRVGDLVEAVRVLGI